jgi:acetoacetyl-CoA reductase/3-oxoacyl-[acyl-carrier protein] reductase
VRSARYLAAGPSATWARTSVSPSPEIIGSTGNIGQANYAASKSGLFGLTKTLAREACFPLQRSEKLTEDPIGVTVNAVAPGFVATGMLEHIPEKVLEPAEVAEVVAFLAGPGGRPFTGAPVTTDQGWTAR